MADLAKSLGEDPTQSIDEDVSTFLEEIGFTRPDPPAPKFPDSKAFSPRGLVLLMTNQCQLRCIYCYAGSGESRPRHLSLETGIAAIDYIVENLKKLNHPKLHVALHGGGEPTYPWQRMKDLVVYAKEKSIPTEITLTSNGIWSKQQTQWIAAYIDYVGISMDGSPQTQDRQRPFLDGRSSSARVMRSLRELEAKQRPYRLRLTAMPPFDHLTEDVCFICENTSCQKMQVEAAFTPQRGGGYQYELEEGKQFPKAFFASRRLAAQYGRKLSCVGSEVDKITAVPCGSPFNSLIVTPQNNLVGCFEVTDDSHPLAELATIGRITSKGVEIDEEARLHLRQILAERRASCRDCFCYWTCAGGCLPRSLSPEPGGHLAYDSYCELRRMLFKEILLQEIAAGDGLRVRRPKRRTAKSKEVQD